MTKKKWDSKKVYKKVAFDIDGVLSDFNTEFIYRVNQNFGTAFDPNGIPTYDYVEEKVGSEELNDFFASEIKNGLFYDLMPYPESQIFLTNLLMRGEQEVHLITARGTEPGIYWSSDLSLKVRKDTLAWLKDYFPMFNTKNLHFGRNKDEIIHKLGVELFVEDKLSTADKLVGVCKSLLLTRSWNAGNTKAVRISSIAEVGFFV